MQTPPPWVTYPREMEGVVYHEDVVPQSPGPAAEDDYVAMDIDEALPEGPLTHELEVPNPQQPEALFSPVVSSSLLSPAVSSALLEEVLPEKALPEGVSGVCAGAPAAGAHSACLRGDASVGSVVLDGGMICAEPPEHILGCSMPT